MLFFITNVTDCGRADSYILMIENEASIFSNISQMFISYDAVGKSNGTLARIKVMDYVFILLYPTSHSHFSVFFFHSKQNKQLKVDIFASSPCWLRAETGKALDSVMSEMSIKQTPDSLFVITPPPET